MRESIPKQVPGPAPAAARTAGRTRPGEPVRRLRICFVDSLRSLGGAELWILAAAAGLARRGHAVSVIAQPGTPLLERGTRLGLDMAAIPIRLDGAPWTLIRLLRLFRSRRIEAVLCNLTKDLKAAGVAARLASIRTVLALRESDFPLKGKFYYRWYHNLIASGVVVNSRATLDSTLAGAPWLEPARVHLLYKGVDLERFRPRAGSHGPDGSGGRAGLERRVGFLGQLITRKGLPELMAAWRMIEAQRRSPPPRLLLAGEGPLRQDLISWRATLRHPEQVELLGFVERTETFLAGLDLLVLPSRAEGFGLAAVEAGACGVPVVASRVSSLPEVVADGKSGLLVAPGNPGALAVAIARLLDEPDLAVALGAGGRRRACALFGQERVLDDLERLLRGSGHLATDPSPDRGSEGR
jgi:glycosyltransferase involved in cell wall biosynthesis